MQGAAPPRLHETASGMLNAIGLQNVGVERFVAEKLPSLRALRHGHLRQRFRTDDRRLCAGRRSAAIALRVWQDTKSIFHVPNVKKGGIVYGSDPAATYEVVKAIKQVASRPVIVKLSPNVTDIVVIARAAEDAGADALSLINTLLGMSIDTETAETAAGKSGLAGFQDPRSSPSHLRMVYQVVRAVKIPVIGIGGIRTAEDALEFLIAGAQAVEIGTANFLDPAAAVKIIDGLNAFCRRKGIQRLRSVVGSIMKC